MAFQVEHSTHGKRLGEIRFFFLTECERTLLYGYTYEKHIPGVLDFRIQSRWACDGHIYVTISFSLEFRISSTSFSTYFHLLPFAMNSQSRSSYPHAVEKNHPRHSPGSLWGALLPRKVDSYIVQH